MCAPSYSPDYPAEVNPGPRVWGSGGRETWTLSRCLARTPSLACRACFKLLINYFFVKKQRTGPGLGQLTRAPESRWTLSDCGTDSPAHTAQIIQERLLLLVCADTGAHRQHQVTRTSVLNKEKTYILHQSNITHDIWVFFWSSPNPAAAHFDMVCMSKCPWARYNKITRYRDISKIKHKYVASRMEISSSIRSWSRKCQEAIHFFLKNGTENWSAYCPPFGWSLSRRIRLLVGHMLPEEEERDETKQLRLSS